MRFKDVFSDRNIDETKHVVKKLLWTAADIGITVAFMRAFGLLPSTKKETTYAPTRYGYGDAVSAITKSSMMSTDKKAAIEFVRQNQSSDYYEAIIALAKSSMMSADKLAAIAGMSRDRED